MPQSSLQTTTIMILPEHWTRFAALCRAQGQSASSRLRQLVARELRRAKAYAAQDAALAAPVTPKRSKRSALRE